MDCYIIDRSLLINLQPSILIHYATTLILFIAPSYAVLQQELVQFTVPKPKRGRASADTEYVAEEREKDTLESVTTNINLPYVEYTTCVKNTGDTIITGLTIDGQCTYIDGVYATVCMFCVLVAKQAVLFLSLFSLCFLRPLLYMCLPPVYLYALI